MRPTIKRWFDQGRWPLAADVMLTGIVLTGLILLGAGCSGGGANGDSGGESGDPDNPDDGSTTAPAAPSGLAADAGEGAVSLSWDAVEEAETYRVYRSTSSIDGVNSALNTGISVASYDDRSAENGTTYYYRVTAVAGEESEASGEVTSTPFASPNGLEGTSGDSEIELNWEESEGAETYNVYRSTESTAEAEGNPLERGIVGANYTDESAKNGTTYYYRVTSVNPEDEESSASNEVERTPFSDPPSRP